MKALVSILHVLVALLGAGLSLLFVGAQKSLRDQTFHDADGLLTVVSLQPWLPLILGVMPTLLFLEGRVRRVDDAGRLWRALSAFGVFGLLVVLVARAVAMTIVVRK